MSVGLIAAAVACNAVLALAAYAKRAVSISGAVIGFLVGFGVFAFGGLAYFIILGTFFVSSSVLSRIGAARKSLLEGVQERGSRRDAVQVLANGGVGLAAAALSFATGSIMWSVAYTASFAAANADTWSSEVGVLSRRRPRSILTWRLVEPGVSGGVTALGLLAGAAGSATIALVGLAALALLGAPVPFGAAVVAVTLGGFSGTIVDSVLGATVQAQYAEQGSGAYTEQRRGPRGTNELRRGISFVTNDFVNFAACLAGTAVASILFLLIR
jgi:uncharacterized protein (TIGR00297 family)